MICKRSQPQFLSVWSIHALLGTNTGALDSDFTVDVEGVDNFVVVFLNLLLDFLNWTQMSLWFFSSHLRHTLGAFRQDTQSVVCSSLDLLISGKDIFLDITCKFKICVHERSIQFEIGSLAILTYIRYSKISFEDLLDTFFNQWSTKS